MSDFASNWKLVQLEDVAEVIDPHPSHRAPRVDPTGVPFVGIGDVNEDGTANFSGARLVPLSTFVEHNERYSLEDDLIGLGRVASVGKVVSLPKADTPYTISPTLAVIAPRSIGKEFLLFALRSPQLQNQLEGMKQGSGRQSVGITKLRTVTIPLPSSAEQVRIVEVLDQQLSRLESALASVKVVREKAEAFRRSLLHAALSGELTGGAEEWREVTLGAIAELSLGIMLDKKKETGLHQVPYLANVNVRWGSFSLAGLKTMQVLPNQRERAEVRLGDVVACEGGEPGRAAVWLSEQPIAIQKALHRIRPRPGVLPSFILYILEERFRGVVDDPLFTGTTIKHLPKEKLERLPLFLPPLAVQEHIVNVLEERLSRLSNALGVASQLEARIVAERRSLLHAAFTGALTAEWRKTHV